MKKQNHQEKKIFLSKVSNNKGISLIALLIIIVILVILIGIGVYLGINKNKSIETEKENLAQGTNQSTNIDSSVAKLKVGDYIKYNTGVSNIGNNGVVTFRVLYQADSDYGLQIISDKNISSITLGGEDFDPSSGIFSSDFEKARTSYNTAIETLNKEAQKYLNLDYAYDARCVGSNPTTQKGKFINKNKEGESPVNLQFTHNGNTTLNCKKEDNNYTEDEKAMRAGKLLITDDYYWLASRYVASKSSHCSLGIRYMNGSMNTFCILSISEEGRQNATRNKYGFRPCISLKADSIKILSGNGTSEASAYTIGK